MMGRRLVERREHPPCCSGHAEDEVSTMFGGGCNLNSTPSIRLSGRNKHGSARREKQYYSNQAEEVA